MPRTFTVSQLRHHGQNRSAGVQGRLGLGAKATHCHWGWLIRKSLSQSSISLFHLRTIFLCYAYTLVLNCRMGSTKHKNTNRPRFRKGQGQYYLPLQHLATPWRSRSLPCCFFWATWSRSSALPPSRSRSRSRSLSLPPSPLPSLSVSLTWALCLPYPVCLSPLPPTTIK